MSMTLISTVTVGAGGASSIDFNSIPQTFTDLVIMFSGRLNEAGQDSNTMSPVGLAFNGVTTNRSVRQLWSVTSGVGAETLSFIPLPVPDNQASSTIFSSSTAYIPNYATASNKSVSIDTVTESNGTNSGQFIAAGVWNGGAAITSLTIAGSAGAGGTLAQYSTASLYGITKGSGGASVA